MPNSACRHACGANRLLDFHTCLISNKHETDFPHWLPDNDPKSQIEMCYVCSMKLLQSISDTLQKRDEAMPGFMVSHQTCKFLKTLNFRFLILFCSECGNKLSVKVELRSHTLVNVSVGRGMYLYTQGLHFTIMLEWESNCSAVLEAPKCSQSSAVSLAKQGKGFLAGSFLP